MHLKSNRSEINKRKHNFKNTENRINICKAQRLEKRAACYNGKNTL